MIEATILMTEVEEMMTEVEELMTETDSLSILSSLIIISCIVLVYLKHYIKRSLKMIDQNTTLINNVRNIILHKETYTIPTEPTAQYDFQLNVVTLAAAHALQWRIPDDKMMQIARLSASYELSYTAVNNKSTQSSGSIVTCETAWIALETALVDLYDRHLINNDSISADDKAALHIHLVVGPDGTSAPITTMAS